MTETERNRMMGSHPSTTEIPAQSTPETPTGLTTWYVLRDANKWFRACQVIEAADEQAARIIAEDADPETLDWIEVNPDSGTDEYLPGSEVTSLSDALPYLPDADDDDDQGDNR